MVALLKCAALIAITLLILCSIEGSIEGSRQLAYAEPTPDKIVKKLDAKKVLNTEYVLLTDDSDHYLAVAPYQFKAMYYGSKKQLWQLPSSGGGSDSSRGKSSTSFWNPLSVNNSAVVLKGGHRWMVQCGKREIPLRIVSEKETQEVFSSADLRETYWIWAAYSLARDNRGVYYYVDHLRRAHGGKGFRLFVGKKGRMKRMKMLNVVSDSQGDVFATPKGDLRLVLNRGNNKDSGDAQWIRGKKKTSLVMAPTWKNRHVIWNELGVYNERIGVPCDDM